MSGRKADSARIYGNVRFGENTYIAQGSVVRSEEESVQIGSFSWVLENSVMIGTPEHPLTIGRKTIFGHRCIAIGASIGDLCEIGNGAIFLPGCEVGSRCIFGEGTIVPAGMKIPQESVVVGRPARVIRKLTQEDHDMIARMRGGSMELPEEFWTVYEGEKVEGMMGKLYPHGEKFPLVHESTRVFDSAEITGDVVIGKNSMIGAGVRIIGDSHGPVIIGDNVHILENCVLHLLPNNRLILEDNVTIGPNCMIHGTKIGAGSVIESGSIICDDSVLGENTLVRSGTLVKQRSEFSSGQILEGFPAKVVGENESPMERPTWALRI